MDEPLEAPQIRVLVIAEDVLARGGLIGALLEWPELTIVGRAAPTEDYPELLASFRPEVVVWDTGWAEAAEPPADWNTAQGPPVLALVQDETQAQGAWQAGARGVVLRAADGSALLAAVQSLAVGLSVASDGLWPGGTQSGLTPETELEDLTPRELEVLQLLAEGLSNRGIAHRLAVSDHTVKFHVNSILTKLNAQSRTEAAVLAARSGLLHF